MHNGKRKKGNNIVYSVCKVKACSFFFFRENKIFMPSFSWKAERKSPLIYEAEYLKQLYFITFFFISFSAVGFDLLF